MTTTVNIKEMHAPQGITSYDDIQVKYSLMNLSRDTVGIINEDNEVSSFGDLKNLIKENGYGFGNFYMQNGFPKPLNEMFTVSKEPLVKYPSDLVEGKQSLTEILLDLARLDSKLIFKEEYYSNRTSGTSFENFKPNFDDIELSASSLIIARKKFNVVLTASIKGVIEVEGGSTEVYRYFPFKIVKFGIPVFNELHIKVDGKNQTFIRRKGLQINDGVAILKLNDYPIFEQRHIDSSVNNLIYLTRLIRNSRIKMKSFRYYVSHLKKAMEQSGVDYDKREWFSGEEVDDEYLSDEGTDFIEVWEKGKKGIGNPEVLLEELGGFGEGMREMVRSFIYLRNVNKAEIEEPLKKCVHAVQTLHKSDTINKEEFLMLATLLAPLHLTGDYKERFIDIKKLIKQESIKLNVLEIKLQTLRWNILKNIDNINTLGVVIGQTKDKVDLQSPVGKIVIKHGKISKETNQFIKPIITENIEE